MTPLDAQTNYTCPKPYSRETRQRRLSLRTGHEAHGALALERRDAMGSLRLEAIVRGGCPLAACSAECLEDDDDEGGPCCQHRAWMHV